MKRQINGHGSSFEAAVPASDLESPLTVLPPYACGGSRPISLAGTPLNIQPYEPPDGHRGRLRSSASADSDSVRMTAVIVLVVWLGGVCLLGYDLMWPLYLLLNLARGFLSIPPFSWVFGWLWTPLSWVYVLLNRGAPLVEQSGALQELRLPPDQVSTYLDSYMQQYGDASLIFATHDGYPQIVSSLLYNRELGYEDLVDASDDNGNTALIYAAAKGYRRCTTALLAHHANPDLANQGGGGRTPLMEAAGGGHKDIVASLVLYNATIDFADAFGNTALHYAAYHGHLSVVNELLKDRPRINIKNSYGHTAASYAAMNRYKAIADVLNRPAKVGKERPSRKDNNDDLRPPAAQRLPYREERHVHGGAEDLHKHGGVEFAPKQPKLAGSVTESEHRSLEDQVSRLKQESEEAELKCHKRIVELLEKTSSQQQAVDRAEREARSLRLNVTELTLLAEEMRSKYQASEVRAKEERQRADGLHQDVQRLQLELESHQSRADSAVRERDLHLEAGRQQQENLRRKTEQLGEHVTHLDMQARELASLREALGRSEEEARRHAARAMELEHQLQTAISGDKLPLPSPLHIATPLPQLPQNIATPYTIANTSAQPPSGRLGVAAGEGGQRDWRQGEGAEGDDIGAVVHALPTSSAGELPSEDEGGATEVRLSQPASRSPQLDRAEV